MTSKWCGDHNKEPGHCSACKLQRMYIDWHKSGITFNNQMNKLVKCTHTPWPVQKVLNP